MSLGQAFLRKVLQPVDVALATLVGLAFAICSLPLFALRGRHRQPPERPRMLYIGYTTLDQAQRKGCYVLHIRPK
jgi:hypothetical protein